MTGINSVYNGLRLLRDAAAKIEGARLTVEAWDAVLTVRCPIEMAENDELSEKLDDLGWSWREVAEGPVELPTEGVTMIPPKMALIWSRRT